MAIGRYIARSVYFVGGTGSRWMLRLASGGVLMVNGKSVACSGGLHNHHVNASDCIVRVSCRGGWGL